MNLGYPLGYKKPEAVALKEAVEPVVTSLIGLALVVDTPDLRHDHADGPGERTAEDPFSRPLPSGSGLD
jgi:hypothetical protein